ncbi:MAG TPA: hypothetical protein VL157_10170 [Gemmatimonadaceae bacterium]|nr:hypothetical protein [Gemmatimonadaceae bacterium]
MTAVIPPRAARLTLDAHIAHAPGTMTPAPNATRLAGEHFAAATLYLLAGALGLTWIAPELAAGAYPSPHVAAVTHLLTLGWITMTIFGALYQLLPVALGAPVRSTRAGHVSFWSFAPGVALFAAGVAIGSTVLRHAGIALVALGVILAVGNIAATLPRARTRDATWAAIALAITFLSSTLALGAILLHNLQTGFIAAARGRVLAAHLHVAVIGWALMMIVGVSHRLLPMFLLAHGADTRWTRPSLAMLAAGVPVLATGIITQLVALSWTGIALIELGVACFIRQLFAFHRVRVKRRLDVGMLFAATALGFLAISAVLGPIAFAAGAGHGRLDTAYVTVGLLGGIVLFIVGFFYKIVPLLAWTARYRSRMGKERVPTVAETFSARVAHVQLVAMALAIALLGSGIAAGSVTIVRMGAVLFVLAVVLFVSQLGRVTLGTPR